MPRRITFSPQQHKRFLARTETDIVTAVKAANDADGDEARNEALTHLQDLMQDKADLRRNVAIDDAPRAEKPASSGKPIRRKRAPRTPQAPAASQQTQPT